MRPQGKKYLSIIFSLIVLAVMPVGCVYDDSPAGCGDARRLQGEVPVRFTLKLDDKGMGSRADAASGVWNPDHEQVIGTRFDSQVSRLHVMLVDNDDNITHVELRKFMYVAEDEGYTFTGNINFGDDGKEAGSYRVMLLANCGPAIMSATTLADLPSTIADVMWYSPNGSPRDGVLIPMWGVTTHDFTFTGDKDAPEEIGDIELLRAVAKVDIQLDPTKMEGYELVSAKINKTNSYINPFPKGWDAAGSTTAQGLRHGAPFNPVKTEVAGHAFTPGKYIDEPAGDIVFYLPEFDSAEGEATIDVVLRHNATGQTLTYTEALHFNDKDVNKGATAGDERLATDIVRNHLYRFTIDGIHFGTLTYNVTCWDYVSSTLGWDIAQNDDHYLHFIYPDSRYCYVTHPRLVAKDAKRLVNGQLENTKVKLLENSSSQLNFSFTITQPEGAVWKAFLYDDPQCTIEHDYKYFRFAPGNNDADNSVAVRTGIAREKAYNLAIDVDRNCWMNGMVDKFSYPDEIDADGNVTSYKIIDKKFFVNKSEESNENEIPTPIITDGSENDVLSPIARQFREQGKVPTVYLVIKVALDGEHFTENLEINPPYTGEVKSQFFGSLTYPGTKTAIQIRQVFVGDYDVTPQNLMEGKIGDNNFGWWETPMGYSYH